MPTALKYTLGIALVAFLLPACDKKASVPDAAPANGASAQADPDTGAPNAPPYQHRHGMMGHGMMGHGMMGSQGNVGQQAAGGDGGTAQGQNAGASDGKQLYAQACSSCHGPAGKGVPGAFPPLAGNPTVTGDKAKLVSIVLDGHSGPIKVEGKTYNGVMPGFGSQYSNAQIAAILTHIRSSWGNSAPAVSAEEVAEAGKAKGD